MKKAISSIVLLAFTCFVVNAQGITGRWEGPLAVGGVSIRLVVNISAFTGGYKASFDSPDQNAFGIPASETKVTQDSVIALIPAMKAVFRGKWNGNGQMNAVLDQGQSQMPLQLKRSPDGKPLVAARNRPQTPKPPFNYYSEEVEYDNAGRNVHYGATFTKPKGKSHFPTVIIISGSGTQDRDGTLFDHKIYAVLADYLTNHGIAVLRVDDRGAGKSTVGSDPAGITSAVFETDVEASLNYLLSRNDLDKNRIGLIGHSEGGIIAPMVAARRKEIAFLVLWGAPAVGGLKINTEQNVYQLKKAGIDSTAVAAFGRLHAKELSLFATAKKEDLDARITAVYANWKKQQSPAILKALFASETSIVGQDLHKLYHSLYDIAWMRYFISYNPATDLSKVRCPVLAINGEKDTQVNAAENLPLIASVLKKNGNRFVQTQMLPSLNHLLQTAETGDASEYEKIEETISPVALAIIAGFVNKQ